jgi:hypothetical protein
MQVDFRIEKAVIQVHGMIFNGVQIRIPGRDIHRIARILVGIQVADARPLDARIVTGAEGLSGLQHVGKGGRRHQILVIRFEILDDIDFEVQK